MATTKNEGIDPSIWLDAANRHAPHATEEAAALVSKAITYTAALCALGLEACGEDESDKAAREAAVEIAKELATCAARVAEIEARFAQTVIG